MELLLEFAGKQGIRQFDLTGGAPELNPDFRRLVAAARERGIAVIDRCNLTILGEPGQEDLGEFLAAQQVEVVASLPCYLEENVDRQRGDGVYAASIAGLRRLNALGYGRPGSDLTLNLVYNPGGTGLPPAQGALETAYRRELGERHGIVFDQLYVLANMPIKRFGSDLLSKGQFHGYMATLKDAHRADNLAGVMCRSLISVGWQGEVYDCDFNQMLALPLGGSATPVMLADLIAVDLENRPISVADHCWGCTAGQGSSCGGALAA
jgi:radical SAM/Cys-rich protein